jgi:hypothetical protein
VSDVSGRPEFPESLPTSNDVAQYSRKTESSNYVYIEIEPYFETDMPPEEHKPVVF